MKRATLLLQSVSTVVIVTVLLSLGSPRPAAAPAPRAGPGGDCVLTCPANLTVSNDPGQCGAVVNFPAPTTTGTCGPVTCSPPSGSFFPVGTTTITCTESMSSCSFDITVVDAEPPVLTCPPNVTALTSQALCAATTAVVNYPAPAVTDNCPGVTVVCTPPSGTSFPLGATTVTCTATDASGNTASCSFTVTVFDNVLQDDSFPSNVLMWNSIDGSYRLCCGGMVFAGTGLVSRRGCTYTLQHFSPTWRILATVDKGSRRGTATLQFPVGVPRCTIIDRNILNDTPGACF